MKTFMALLQREYWEHKGAFRTTPMIIGIILLVLLFIAYLLSYKFDMKFAGGSGIVYGMAQLAQLPGDQISLGLDAMMLSTSSLFHMVLYIVVFFFLLGSLYDDRKDGSILFWKSLPVSDFKTVMSKILMGIVIVPLLFTFFVILTHLAILTLVSILLLFHGQNPFTLLWANSQLFANWGAFILGCFTQAIWALPIYGWLLFCSAWSNRRPFLWAVLIPVTLTFIWGTINAFIDFDFKKYGLYQEIGLRIGRAFAPFGSVSEDMFEISIEKGSTASTLSQSMFNSLLQTQHIYGLLFALVTIGLAIYIRRYRNTT